MNNISLTINIPALDRLCDLLTSINNAEMAKPCKTTPPVNVTPITNVPVAVEDNTGVSEPPPECMPAATPKRTRTPKAVVPATAAMRETVVPTDDEEENATEETPAAPTVTVEEAADLARAIVKKSNVLHLRGILDNVIGTNVRITEADKSLLPALVEKLNIELKKL